jgi:hypothetical protein
MIELWYGISSVILGVLLFFPMRKFVYGLGINKLQRKMNRAATEEEQAAQKRRATMIAGVLALTFAFLYNKFVMVKFWGGVK